MRLSMGKINSYWILRAVAALVAAVTLTGCSLLKVSVSTGEPLSKREMNVRTMTRGFYYDLSGEVSRAADSIVAASADVPTRIAAVRWKIRATRAGVSAVMQSIPDVALADMWILCRRMNESLAVAPDSLLFGPQSDIARVVAARLDGKVAKLAEELLWSERYEQMADFVEEYVRKNPSTDGAETTNTTLAWLQYLRACGVDPAYGTGSISEVLSDVNDRLSGQTQQLSNSIGWSKDILEMQLGQDSLRSEIGRQLDSLERNFDRLASVAENLPGISEQMMKQFNGQVTQLIWTMNASVDNAFAHLDRQRGELQQYISSERETLIDQARQAADEAVQKALEGIPALIGKILFYVVLALVILLGLPFAAGYWLGGYRQRARERKK